MFDYKYNKTCLGMSVKGDTFSRILEISITTGEYYCIFKIQATFT